MNASTAPTTVKETIAWLLRLNRPPLPECPLEAAKQGRTQKQPQYFDGRRLVPISWQEWQKQLPIPEVYEAWFKHPATGIGTLGGWNGRHWLGWVDFDVDDFGSIDAMHSSIAAWFRQYPAIASAPQFESPSGGFRVLLAFEREPDTGANNGFALAPNATQRMGELLIKNGGHTLLPPTVGANGKRYEWIKWSEYPPIFPDIESAGIYPVRDAKTPARTGTTAERKSQPPQQRSANLQGQNLVEILEREIYPRLTADRLFGDLEDFQHAGKNAWCPFCTTREKAPSFNVSEEKHVFFCYGCNATGTWADFIMLRDRVEFREAVKTLGEMVGVELPAPAPCREYATVGSKNQSRGFSEPPPKKLPLREAAAKARVILTSGLPELEENLELEAVRAQCGMGSYDWEDKIVKPLKKDLEGERFKLELKNLLAIEDAVERLRQQAQLAPRYSMSGAMLEKALQVMKVRTGTPETRVWTLEEFFDRVSGALEWTIPGFLPKGETILLIAPPKTGKTLLAIDATYAIATGDSFLGEECKQGRVLIVSVDESAQSTRAKLLKRGFRRQDSDSVRVIDKWDISQLTTLEAVIEDFRPSLVIVDSLKRITHGSEVSENAPEFADNIYALKEIFNRYGASGILIHHAKKDKDAYGVDMARGSSAIAGATWGQWQLKQIPVPDPDNPKRMVIDPRNPERTFLCYSRDTDGEALKLWFNADNNSFENLGAKDFGEESAKENEKERGLRERIVNLLRLNQPQPLSGREIIELMEFDPKSNEGRGVYTALGRLVARRIICQFPAPGDKRVNLYSLHSPNTATQPDTATQSHTPAEDSRNVNPTSEPEISSPPPSPPDGERVVEYSSESSTQQEFEDTQQNTQQILNTYSTPLVVEEPVEHFNSISAGSSGDTQHSPSEIGGGGGETPNCANSEDSLNETVLSDTMIDDAPLPAGHGENPADASDVLVGELPSEIELVAGHLFWATQQSEEEGRLALAHIREHSSPEQLRLGARLLQQQGRGGALIAIERWIKELNAAAVTTGGAVADGNAVADGSAVAGDDAVTAGDAQCSVGAEAEGDVAGDRQVDAAANIDAGADGVPAAVERADTAAVTDTATSHSASTDRSVDTAAAIDAGAEETDTANNFPKVGDLVWRSPIPSEWNSKTQQRKPSQPGCVCRVVQLTNNGAIALCEKDGSRFHISWHAWESGLFAPYRGSLGR